MGKEADLKALKEIAPSVYGAALRNAGISEERLHDTASKVRDWGKRIQEE